MIHFNICLYGYNHRVSTWRVGHDNCCHRTKICDNSWCVPGGVWWTPFPGWSASCRKGKWLRRSLHLAKYPCHHHYISTSGYFPNFTSFGNVSWMKMVVITIYHRNIPWAYTLAWLCLLIKVCRPTWPRSSKGQRSVFSFGQTADQLSFQKMLFFTNCKRFSDSPCLQWLEEHTISHLLVRLSVLEQFMEALSGILCSVGQVKIVETCKILKIAWNSWQCGTGSVTLTSIILN